MNSLLLHGLSYDELLAVALRIHALKLKRAGTGCERAAANCNLTPDGARDDVKPRSGLRLA